MRPIDRIHMEIASLGPAGRSPVAPGTVGSAVAVLLAPLCFLPLSLGPRLALLASIYLLGSISSGRAEQIIGRKDPGRVVVDELLGQWITLLPFAALSVWGLVGAFLLFRLFDIAKPWPVRASERWLPGGQGVMLDDAFAGCYAALALWGISQVIS